LKPQYYSALVWVAMEYGAAKIDRGIYASLGNKAGLVQIKSLTGRHIAKSHGDTKNHHPSFFKMTSEHFFMTTDCDPASMQKRYASCNNLSREWARDYR